MAVTGLAGSRSHWASASSLALSIGAWAAKCKWHLPASRSAPDVHSQPPVRAGTFPEARASPGLHHPLQATDCCLADRDSLQALSGSPCQAPACHTPQGGAGLLAGSGMGISLAHAPAQCPLYACASDGCHAEDTCVLCCRETEQDLYNILGALYSAVLYVSSEAEPACRCRSPCGLPGLPLPLPLRPAWPAPAAAAAPAACLACPACRSHTRVLRAPPRDEAHCCLLRLLGPLAPAGLFLSRPAEACLADLQLQLAASEMLTLCACSWVS